MMLLWIRRVFSTRSAVYVDTNWLDKDCIQPEQMLEKKRLVDKDVVSAHPILCISSGLSTAELLPGAFRPLFASKTGSEAVFWCRRSAPSDVQSCWQAGSVLSRPDFSLARIAIMVVDLVSFPSVRRKGQSGQIQTRTNGPDNFFSSFNKRVSIGSFVVVDAEGVCATSCQTFLQRRTRQRMQYPGPFFLGFSPALAHFIFLISR